MAAMQKAVSTNAMGLEGVTSLLSSIFGQGKVTTNTAETNQGSPYLQNIISQSMANANDSAKTQAIVSNIMEQAATNFAQTAQGQNTAGMYNSSVHKLLSGYAQGQAVGQASQAVLNYQTSQQQIATQAASALAANTRSTQQTQKQANPMGGALGTALGIGSAGLAVARNWGDIKDFARDPAGKISNAFDFGWGFDSGKELDGLIETAKSLPSGGTDVFDSAAALDDLIGSAANFSDGASVTSAAIDGASGMADIAAAGGDILSVGEAVAELAGGAGSDLAVDGFTLSFADSIDYEAGGDLISGIGDTGIAASDIGVDAADFGIDVGMDFGENFATDAVGDVMSDIGSVASDIGETLMTGLSTVGDVISPFPGFGTVLSLAADSPLGDVPIVGDVINFVDNAYDTVVGGAIDAVIDVGSGIVDAVENVGDWIGDIFDSGCFITTAVCSEAGEPDDCETLQVLRNFRDTYMQETEEGRADVAEYYRIAPEIVKRLAEAGRSDVYETIRRIWIKPCVALIKNGEFKQAHLWYKDMVLSLKETYLPDWKE